MFFKNLQIFQLNQKWAVTAAELNDQLSKFSFAQCPSNEMQSQGWVSPTNNDMLVHAVGGQLLIALATEKKLLPSTVINQVLKVRAAELEESQGFAPGRKAMKDLKERVIDELIPRAFGIKRTIFIWIDPINHWLVIDTTSATVADDVVKLLLKTCGTIPLESLRVKTSPQSAMTGWLASNEAPAGFSIDQDTELKSNTENKALVRYVRHSVDPDDVQKHIASGKQCSKLAMTWNSRVSFVLTDTLTIKRINPLDVLEDSKEKGYNQEERFDSDFALMTGELGQLLHDLVETLGGFAD